MTTTFPSTESKKLLIILRVEAGCLGPQGEEHILKFCELSNKSFNTINSDFIYWEMIPRKDKILPEIQYKIGNKILPHEKAKIYLSMYNQDIDELEEQISNKILSEIDLYFSHK